MTRRSGWPGYLAPALVARSARTWLWRATREQDGAAVLIKQAGADPAARLALEAEREVLARADHPGVVPLVDVLPGPCLVLPFLPGGSLADRLQRQPAPTPDEAAALVLAVAAALAHLHDRGSAHGDLSPANVVFDGGGRPVLVDPTGPHHRAATPGYHRPGASAVERDRHALVVLGMELAGPTSALGRALAPLASLHAAAPTPAEVVEVVMAAGSAVGGSVVVGSAGGGSVGATAAEHPGDLRPLWVEPPTTSWGPTPPPPDEPARGRRRARRSSAVATRTTAAAIGLVGVALLGVGVAVLGGGRSAATCSAHGPAAVDRGAPPEPGRPAGAVLGDLDGDGCDELVRWSADQAVVRLPDGRRFALGRAGDHLVLGDWTCEGVDRPGVYRPSTGQVFTFDRWPEAGASTTSHDVTDTGIRAGVPEVVAPTGAGCDLVAVDPP